MAAPRRSTLVVLSDGSDAIADWPILDAMTLCASTADLVALHSGGGYLGCTTSAGVTIVADGTAQAADRLTHALTNDTSLGLFRYADEGYSESLEEIEAHSVPHIRAG
jgi:urocanate hydratase